jgi:hypothetical protein
MASRRHTAEDDAPADGLLGAVAGLFADVRAIARERAASMARAAEHEADRIEGRLRRVAVLGGACIAAGALLVIGISGGLGELTGRTWLGQLGAALFVLLVVVLWTLPWRRWTGRKAPAPEQDSAPESVLEAGRSVPLMLVAGAAGWVAGLVLGHRKGHRR